jgi:CubicO group peptidase (beta-lactamase class C family)
VARLISFVEGLGSGPSAATLPSSGGPSAAAHEAGAGPDLAQLAALAPSYLAPGGPLFKALEAPGGALSDPDIWHSSRLHAAEIPAANGICDARSLARLYAACVSDITTAPGTSFRILSPRQLDRAVRQETTGPDTILLGLDIQWGLGFNINRGLIEAAGLGGPRAFGHFGMGGSAGWADPDAELAMGYVMNRMEIGTTGDARSFRLMQACLDAVRH